MAIQKSLLDSLSSLKRSGKTKEPEKANTAPAQETQSITTSGPSAGQKALGAINYAPTAVAESNKYKEFVNYYNSGNTDYETSTKYRDEAAGWAAAASDNKKKTAWTDMVNALSRKTEEDNRVRRDNAQTRLAEIDAELRQIKNKTNAERSTSGWSAAGGDLSTLTPEQMAAFAGKKEDKDSADNLRTEKANLEALLKEWGYNGGEERENLIDKYRNSQGGFFAAAAGGGDMLSAYEEMKTDREAAEAFDREHFNVLEGEDDLAYTAVDRAMGAAASSALGIGSGLLGTQNILAKTYGEEEARKAYDNIYGSGAYDKVMAQQRANGATDPIAEIDATIDMLDEKSAREIERAKKGASGLGKFALDMEKTALEIGFDMAVGTVTGSSLVPMFTRVLGSEASAARRDGASVEQQLAYGVTKAGIEVLTEKIGGAFDKIGYGKGLTNEWSERLINKLANTDAGKTALRLLIGALEEGGEEALSDVLAPFADMIYKEGTFKEHFSEETENIWYDMLLGSAMGFLGNVGGIATGADAQANYELYEGNLRGAQEAMRTGAEMTPQQSAALARFMDTGEDVLRDEAPTPKAQTHASAKPEDETQFTQGAEDTARTPKSNSALVNRVLENGSTGNYHAIDNMLSYPQEIRAFESATGEKVTGNTIQEKRASVREILKGIEAENKTADARQSWRDRYTAEQERMKSLQQANANRAETIEAAKNAQKSYDPEVGAITLNPNKTVSESSRGGEVVVKPGGQEVYVDENGTEHVIGEGDTIDQEKTMANWGAERVLPPTKKPKVETEETIRDRGEKRRAGVDTKVDPRLQEKLNKLEEEDLPTRKSGEANTLREKIGDKLATVGKGLQEKRQAKKNANRGAVVAADEGSTATQYHETQNKEQEKKNRAKTKAMVEAAAEAERQKRAEAEQAEAVGTSDTTVGTSDTTVGTSDTTVDTSDTIEEKQPVVSETKSARETALENEVAELRKQVEENNRQAKEQQKANRQNELLIAEMRNLVSVLTNQAQATTPPKTAQNEEIGSTPTQTPETAETPVKPKAKSVKPKAEIVENYNHNVGPGEEEIAHVVRLAREGGVQALLDLHKDNAEFMRDVYKELVDEDLGKKGKREKQLAQLVDELQKSGYNMYLTAEEQAALREENTVAEETTDTEVQQTPEAETPVEPQTDVEAETSAQEETKEAEPEVEPEAPAVEETPTAEPEEVTAEPETETVQTEAAQTAAPQEETKAEEPAEPQPVKTMPKADVVKGIEDASLSMEQVAQSIANGVITIDDVKKITPGRYSTPAGAINAYVSYKVGKGAELSVSEQKKANRLKSQAENTKKQNAQRTEDLKDLQESKNGSVNDYAVENFGGKEYLDDLSRQSGSNRERVSASNSESQQEPIIPRTTKDSGSGNSRIDESWLQTTFKKISESFGRSEAETEKITKELTNRINDLESKGHRLLSPEEIPESVKKAIDVYAKHGIKSVFVFDSSKAKTIELLGEVVDGKPEFGVTLFLNTQRDARSVQTGASVMHEPYHLFRAMQKWFAKTKAEKANLQTDKAGLDYVLFKDIARKNNKYKLTSEDAEKIKGRVLQHQTRVMYEEYYKDALIDALDSILFERGMEVPREKVEKQIYPAYKQWQTMPYEMQLKKLQQYGVQYDEAPIYEEVMAELSSEHSRFNKWIAENYSEEVADAIAKSAQFWAEGNGVSEGFYDDLRSIAQEVDAYSDEQFALREQAGQNQPTEKGKVSPSAKALRVEQAGRTVPDGVEAASKSKAVSERVTAGMMKDGTPLSHEKVSNEAYRKVAEANYAKYGYEAERNYLLHQGARNLVPEEIIEAQLLLEDATLELMDRMTDADYEIDTEFPRDTADLQKDIDDLKNLISNTKSAASRNLSVKSNLTNSYQIIINAAKQFVNGDPNKINDNSENAKLFRVVKNHVDYIDSIKDGDTDAMIKEIKEIAKIRGVNKIFGQHALGKMMQNVENNLLDWVKENDENAFETLKNMAYSNANSIVSDFNVVAPIKAIQQYRYLGMLSNFATKVSNILNNSSSVTSNSFAQFLARMATNKRANKLMGETTLAKDYSNRHIGSKADAMNRYMFTEGAKSVLGLYYGIGGMNDSKIDTDIGARFNQNGGAVERFMAAWQFMSGLGMETTDILAKARTYKGMELGIDEMNVSEERKAFLKEEAKREAEYRLFHNNSKAADAIAKIRSLGNRVQFGNDYLGKMGLGDVLIPFVKVPVNVASMAIRSSPIGALAGMGRYVYGMSQLEYRSRHAGETGANGQEIKAPTHEEVVQLQRTLGRALSSATVSVIGALAAMCGALKDFDNEDDDTTKRLMKEHGYTGLQFNFSALGQPNHEWDPEKDWIIGGSWLEVMAIPLVAGYEIYDAWSSEGGSGVDALRALAESPISSITTIMDALEEIPGIKQFTEAWKSYQNLQQYEELDKGISKAWASIVQQGVNDATTFLVPNLISQASAGLDNTVREVYRGDTTAEIARNIFLNKTPFRYTLPEAKDSFNQTRRYGENKALGLMNRMLLPGTGIQVYRQSPLEQLYAALGKEGYDNAAVKANAPKKITISGENYPLNTEQQREWKEIANALTETLHTAAMNNADFQKMTESQQNDILTQLRQHAEHEASNKVLRDMHADAEVDLDKWEEELAGEPEKQVQFLTAKRAAKSLYDKDKKITSYTKMDEYIKGEYAKLNETQKKLLSTSYSRLDDMWEASKEGISSQQYDEAYRLWQSWSDKEGHEEETASQRARDLAVDIGKISGLNASQKQWLEDHLVITSTIPANKDTFNKVRGAGFSTEAADKWLDSLTSQPIKGGYKNMSKNQTYQYIRDYPGLSDEERWKLFDLYATDSAKEKVGEYRDLSFADALAKATYWQKVNGKWQQRKYTTIYPKEG